MTTPANPDDLITWLRAIYDERERVARAAAAGGRWSYSKGDSVGAWTLYDEHWSIASMTVYDTERYNYSERMPAVRHPGYIDPDAIGEHIADNDPAYVLADLDAKRRILDRHGPGVSHPDECGRCNDPWPCDDALLLALPFADREGFREEWRPA